MERETVERLQIKTAEQRFLTVLEQEFREAPRVAQALLEEAQTCLFGAAQQMRPGQMRVILARGDAGPGRGLMETPMTEVVWTVDAGLEDREVLQQRGHQAMCHPGSHFLLLQALIILHTDDGRFRFAPGCQHDPLSTVGYAVDQLGAAYFATLPLCQPTVVCPRFSETNIEWIADPSLALSGPTHFGSALDLGTMDPETTTNSENNELPPG